MVLISSHVLVDQMNKSLLSPVIATDSSEDKRQSLEL